MLRKIKLTPSPTCSCGLEDQTAEHILQRCPLLQTTRKNVWPTAVLLHTKTYATYRNWRRRPHPSCRLDFQCSGDWEEVHRAECVQADPTLYCIHNCSTRVKHLVYFQFVVPCYSIFSVKFHTFFPVVTKNVSNLAVGVPNYKKSHFFFSFLRMSELHQRVLRKSSRPVPSLLGLHHVHQVFRVFRQPLHLSHISLLWRQRRGLQFSWTCCLRVRLALSVVNLTLDSL